MVLGKNSGVKSLSFTLSMFHKSICLSPDFPPEKKYLRHHPAADC